MASTPAEFASATAYWPNSSVVTSPSRALAPLGTNPSSSVIEPMQRPISVLRLPPRATERYS